ncbi:TonB-dependent receptor [Pontibacter burrus]|uniref:TonB-dependent receptor n=1 Tax=Pontibacter burrus TaxID=2704466 RepID=A0A6B3LXL2_9BACT|nr:carboxypeptidase regulatory-like domain-containing protein [Pontibacter burrus]NEM98211.1 TonB-dependent receptor [Pontibacter burrus]
MLLSIAGVQAQVTTSSINGSVKDASGEALIGATVKATHQPSGTVYGAATNIEGQFNIANMRVGGPYLVEVSYIGFQPTKYEGITLQLGRPYVLNATLAELGRELQEIVVSADRSSVFNAQRTGAATNVSREQISSLPTISRSLTDFTRLTPQANNNGFAGRDGRFNNVQIDGANFNNGFGLNSNLLPGGSSQPISIDAIEQVQVNIAPYDVRQSGFTGAGVNAVTRSGSNEFSGSVYGFYRNQDLVGYKVNGNDLPDPNETSSRTMGFRLGGPIIKNKLFFFVNAENIENVGTNPFAVNLWRPSEDGVANPDQNIARTKRSDLEAVRNHLINTWGYDPGAFENYANDNGSKSNNFLARIDWNISDKHKLAVRYNQVIGQQSSLVNGASGPQPRSGGGNNSAFNRVSQNSIAFEKTMYSTDDIIRSGSIELNSTLSSRLSNQFLATYSRIQQTRKSPSEIFPMVDIGDGSGIANNTYSNYMTFGYELFTYGNDVLNNNYSILNNLTYLLGKHTITGGFAYESQKFGNQYIRLGTSYYRYNSVADFLTTGTPNEVAPIMFGLTYPYEGQDPYAPIVLGTGGIYVQDKYSVSNRLDITAGVRADIPVYMNDLTANPSIDNLVLLDQYGNPKKYTTSEWPRTRVMLSPRIGFNYDAFGDGSLTVRGGTGLFSGRVPFVWLTNMPSNSGVIQNNVEPNGYASVAGWIGDIRFNPDPYHWLKNTPPSAADVFIKNPKAGVPNSFALVDNEFRMPKVWRSSIGADYTIPGTPLVATTDILFTKDINAAYQFGANRNQASQHMNYGGDGENDYRAFWPGGANTAKYNAAAGANTGVVLTNTTVKGYSFSATAGLSLPERNGLYGGLYYTYTDAKDVSGNPGSNASSAWTGNPTVNGPNEQILSYSQYALPHNVVANLSFRKEYIGHLATTISVFYNGSHQGRFSYIYGTDFNNDGINADLLYIPNNSNNLNFVDNKVGDITFTAQQQREAFDAFIENDKYLKTRRGQYAERNGALLPWLNRFDVKLVQDVFTNIGGKRNTLQFSADIMNIGNLINSEWGIQKQSNGAQNLLRSSYNANTGVRTFTMTTVSENGQTVLPKNPYRDVTTVATTWYGQLGLRYIFN